MALLLQKGGGFGRKRAEKDLCNKQELIVKGFKSHQIALDSEYSLTLTFNLFIGTSTAPSFKSHISC